MLDPAELTQADIERWQALEARAIEANAYQTPQFLLPYFKHFGVPKRVRVVLVERHACGGTEVIAASVQQLRPASALLPAPHLASFRHEFAPQAHWLVDAAHAREACIALDRHARREAPAGIVHLATEVDGPLMRAWSAAAAELGHGCHRLGARERAVLSPAQGGEPYLQRHLKKQLSKFERRRRKLAEGGAVRWQAHREAVPGDSVDAFLRLEHAGWKGEGGSSMLSCPRRSAFFREMVAGFAHRRAVLITELTLDDKAIASSCTLLSGRGGSTFKVAYDPEHAKAGPGILNEVEMLRHAPAIFDGAECIDSGAAPGSFIEDFWVERRTVGSIVFPRPGLGSLAWKAGDLARQARSRWARSAAAASLTCVGADLPLGLDVLPMLA